MTHGDVVYYIISEILLWPSLISRDDNMRAYMKCIRELCSISVSKFFKRFQMQLSKDQKKKRLNIPFVLSLIDNALRKLAPKILIWAISDNCILITKHKRDQS